jgi:outer membrane protein TolC
MAVILRISLIALFVQWTADIQAQQDTLHLTLSDCIRIANEQSPTIKMAKAAYQSSRYTHSAFFEDYLPQFSIVGSAPGYSRSIGSVIQPDGTILFLPQSQASSSLNLTMQQKVPFTGGSLYLSSGLSRLDDINTKNVLYRSTPLSLTYQQPLFKLNTLRWNADIEDMRFIISQKEYEEAMEDGAIDVTTKFFDVYTASMNAANAQFNLTINDTLFQITKGRYNVGKIAENDLLQSELAYLNAETQLGSAQLQLNRAVKALAITLGLEKDAVIVPIPPQSIPKVIVDEDIAMQEALNNRSDALNFQLQTLNARKKVEQTEFDNNFSATLTANAGFNQRSSKLSDAYQQLMDQQQFSVSFEVPLFTWGKGSDEIEAARADERRTLLSIETQRKNFEMDVRYQVARLKLLERQAFVAAKSDTIAQRRFDVAKDRYMIGKIDVPNLFLAQSEKDDARRAYVQMLLDYWGAYYRLRRLTLYDFLTGTPLSGLKRNGLE